MSSSPKPKSDENMELQTKAPASSTKVISARQPVLAPKNSDLAATKSTPKLPATTDNDKRPTAASEDKTTPTSQTKIAAADKDIRPDKIPVADTQSAQLLATKPTTPVQLSLPISMPMSMPVQHNTMSAISTGQKNCTFWSEEEDQALRTAVREVGARNWKRIANDYLKGNRTDVQCLHRWQKVLRPGLIKGPWTQEEDAVIQHCIQNNIVKWSVIASKIPGRLGKQCRERWLNHLDPSIKKVPWTPEEDKILDEAQALYGNRWCSIAKLIPGRTENAVKNRWNSAMRKKWQEKQAKQKIGITNGLGSVAPGLLQTQQGNTDALRASIHAHQAAIGGTTSHQSLLQPANIGSLPKGSSPGVF